MKANPFTLESVNGVPFSGAAFAGPRVPTGPDGAMQPAYRYLLWRRTWKTPEEGGELLSLPEARLASSARGSCVFVMLNPSTADALVDDATIRKCIGFARRWGCERLSVVNLFAWRSRHPNELLIAAEDPVGADNDAHIRREVSGARKVVCGWGTHKATRLGRRAEHVLSLIQQTLGDRCEAELSCLRRAAGGEPWHPLYIPYSQALQRFP